MVEEVGLEIKAGVEFDETEAVRGELEDGALGDVKDLLAAGEGRRTVEADMLDFLHELGLTLGEESTAEDEAAGTLGDVHEAADTGKTSGKTGDIHTAFGIDFHGTEHGDVEAATIVEVELRGLVDDGFGKVAATEAQARGGDATGRSAFNGEGKVTEATSGSGDLSDGLRQADAEIDNVAGADLAQGALANGSTVAGGKFGDSAEVVTGGDVGRVEGFAKGLLVITPGADDEMIDEQARDTDGFGIGDAINDPLDLSNDDATVIFGGLGEREDVSDEALALKGEVALGIGTGGADEGDVNGNGLVAQPGLAIEVEALDEGFGGAFVEAAATVLGIDEGVEADLSEDAGAFSGDLTEKDAEYTLGQVVGLDFVGESEGAEFGGQVPVAADNAAKQAAMGEVIEAAIVAVALPSAVEESEVLRGAGLEKALFEGGGQEFGMARTDEAANTNRNAAGDGGDGFSGG